MSPLGFTQEKVNYCVAQTKQLSSSSEALEIQKREATNLIEESFDLFYSELVKKKESLLMELKKRHTDRKTTIADHMTLVNEACTNMQSAILFSEDYALRASVENMASTHNLIGGHLMKSYNSTPSYPADMKPIQFVYDFSHFSKIVDNGYGYFVDSAPSGVDKCGGGQREVDQSTDDNEDSLSECFSKFINITPTKFLNNNNNNNNSNNNNNNTQAYNNNNLKQLSPYAISFNPTVSFIIIIIICIYNFNL